MQDKLDQLRKHYDEGVIQLSEYHYRLSLLVGTKSKWFNKYICSHTTNISLLSIHVYSFPISYLSEFNLVNQQYSLTTVQFFSIFVILLLSPDGLTLYMTKMRPAGLTYLYLFHVFYRHL